MPLVSISGPGLEAQIDTLGAQLYTLRDSEGRDLLWSGDPAVWASRAPILFPIVGALAGGQYRLGDRSFSLRRHGFARTSPFAVAETGASSATLRLAADAETLAVYPFDFELDITFAIEGETLTMTATIRNRGAERMPASFGFHPATPWPLPYGQPREDHVLTFDRPEPGPIRRIDAEGLILPDPLPTPVVGRDLLLRDDLFVDDAVVWDRIQSGGLTYGAKAGPRLRFDFQGAPDLGVWTKPGAGYICVEPWWGHADPQGYAGDIRDKPGIFIVEPGAERRCVMSIGLDR
jgi:galactose mutarotase-like enzyme